MRAPDKQMSHLILGISYILTPGVVVKRIEYLWKGMSADSRARLSFLSSLSWRVHELNIAFL